MIGHHTLDNSVGQQTSHYSNEMADISYRQQTLDNLIGDGTSDISVGHGTSDNSIGQTTSDISNETADTYEKNETETRDISVKEVVEQNPKIKFFNLP